MTLNMMKAAILTLLLCTTTTVVAAQSSIRRRSLQATCPGLENVENELPAEDVERAAVAGKLSSVVYLLDDYDNNEDVDYNTIDSNINNPLFLEDTQGIDGVLLTNYANKYCVAAFRGTQPELWDDGGREDWWSNVDMRESVIEFDAHTCHVHRGYHEAYTLFEYRREMEQYLTDCMIECPTCQLLFTGHSQGGSIATIAAIEWMKQDIENALPVHDEEVDNMSLSKQSRNNIPFVITLGAPQGLGVGCAKVLQAFSNHYSTHISCRWFHYVMSIAGAFGLTYDAVPMVFPHLLKGLAEYTKSDDDSKSGFAYLGHELLISTQQTDSLLYIGLDTHRFDMPYSARAHWDWLYRDVLVEMWEGQNGDGNGIDYNDGADSTATTVAATPTHGFTLGALCNVDEECISHRCQREKAFSWKKECV